MIDQYTKYLNLEKRLIELRTKLGKDHKMVDDVLDEMDLVWYSMSESEMNRVRSRFNKIFIEEKTLEDKKHNEI